MHQNHQRWFDRIIIVGFHATPPMLGAWTAHLWNTGHEVLTLFIGACTVVVTVGLWARDLWMDEVAEKCSPNRAHEYPTEIEPPRPLPAFPVEENPSRIRVRHLVDSVAPPDADNEDTQKWVS